MIRYYEAEVKNNKNMPKLKFNVPARIHKVMLLKKRHFYVITISLIFTKVTNENV